jgi:hypothetical protein
LEAYLIFDGQTLLLFQGLLGEQMSNTLFNDTASDPIDVAGVAPFSSSFQPQSIGFGLLENPTISSLSEFNGLNPNGTWTLRIYDRLQDGQVGTFGGANLSATAVPVPPLFMGTAVAMIAGTILKYRKRPSKAI